MRKSILLPLLMLPAGCGEAVSEAYAIVEAVPDRAAAVACEPVRLEDAPTPTEIRLSTDSTWTLLDAPQRQILELDQDLRILHRTRIPERGPGAAEHPVSVAALGDTAWAVAARGGLRVVLLSRAGEELATIPLDFIPHSIEAAGPEGLLLTAMPFGGKPPTLLVRLRDRELTPVAVPRRSYPDMTINALGNTALVESLGDGSALVVHQFLAPRAFRVEPSGAVLPLRLPTPAGTRDAIDFVPRAPVTEEQLPLALLPAIAMSVDRSRGHVYVLTRSGRDLGGRPERAVLRLTEDLEFIDGFVLDVPAAGLVYLPGTGAAVTYDDQDRFYTCRLPAADV